MIKQEYYCKCSEPKLEKIVRTFILGKSDTVILQATTWYEVGFFFFKKSGGRKDVEFVKVLRKFIPFLWKQEEDNYYFKLSEKIKGILNKTSLFWSNSFSHVTDFYGFKNPMFFKKNDKIAEVISDQGTILLYLTNQEKRHLNKKGIILEKIIASKKN